MEFLCKFLVLLFVILYYINSIAGQGLDSTKLTLYRRCQGIVVEQGCNNGLLQEFVDLAYRCNQSQAAEATHVSCQHNPSGRYCGLAFAFYAEVTSIQSVCATSDTSCTDQCRTLLTNIRNDLGCCISVTFNDSSGLFANVQAFRYSLWSSCGIEPVANDCMSSSVTLTHMPVDPMANCNITSYSTAQLHCTQRYIEPLLNALSAEQNCHLYHQSALEMCGVNEFGRACHEEPSLASGFLNAFNNCRNTTTCDPGCISALRKFNQSSGCCINNVYNGSSLILTGSSYDWLSNSFWSMCGLETPGICEARFNGSTLPPQEPGNEANGAAAHAVPWPHALIILLIAVFWPWIAYL